MKVRLNKYVKALREKLNNLVNVWHDTIYTDTYVNYLLEKSESRLETGDEL